MSSPRVTVLMSVYNSARYLDRAMRSILDQTFEDFELLIINDGSKDESPRMLEAYKDPRIRLIHTENRGLAAALELGMREARGAYVARMDSDDIALPERLELQVDYLDRNPTIGVVDADHQQIDMEDQEMRTENDPVLAFPAMISWKLIWQNVVCHPLVMMRREALKNGSINYDPRCVTEDYDLWARLLPHTRFGHISKVLLKYRRNPAGMTGTRGRSQLESMTRIHQRTVSELVGYDVGVELGRSLAYLSQQTVIPPSENEGIAEAGMLAGLAARIRSAFLQRYSPSEEETHLIDRDLSRRFLEWGFALSRLAGRAGESTGLLMGRAVALDPVALVDRRFWRNLVARGLGTERYLRLRSGG